MTSGAHASDEARLGHLRLGECGKIGSSRPAGELGGRLAYSTSAAAGSTPAQLWEPLTQVVDRLDVTGSTGLEETRARAAPGIPIDVRRGSVLEVEQIRPDAFDVVVSDAGARARARVAEALRGIAAVLSPGGSPLTCDNGDLARPAARRRHAAEREAGVRAPRRACPVRRARRRPLRERRLGASTAARRASRRRADAGLRDRQHRALRPWGPEGREGRGRTRLLSTRVRGGAPEEQPEGFDRAAYGSLPPRARPGVSTCSRRALDAGSARAGAARGRRCGLVARAAARGCRPPTR